MDDPVVTLSMLKSELGELRSELRSELEKFRESFRKELQADIGLAVSAAMEESRAWFRLIDDRHSAALADHAADTTLHKKRRATRAR